MHLQQQTIDEIRLKRYEIARKMWSDEFFEDRKMMKSINTVNEQSLECFKLELDYNDAEKTVAKGLEELGKKVDEAEKLSIKNNEGVNKLGKTLDDYNRRKLQYKSELQNEDRSDNKVFNKAEKAIRNRIESCHERIIAIKDAIDAIEVEEVLRNPKGQELLNQLRALLSAQQKDLKFLESRTKADF